LSVGDHCLYTFSNSNISAVQGSTPGIFKPMVLQCNDYGDANAWSCCPSGAKCTCGESSDVVDGPEGTTTRDAGPIFIWGVLGGTVRAAGETPSGISVVTRTTYSVPPAFTTSASSLRNATSTRPRFNSTLSTGFPTQTGTSPSAGDSASTSNNAAKLGAAIGVPVGAGIFGGIAFAAFLYHRRKKRQQPGQVNASTSQTTQPQVQEAQMAHQQAHPAHDPPPYSDTAEGTSGAR